MKMRKVKIFTFTGVDRFAVPPTFGSDTIPVRWWGDCPLWAAETRRDRPDLTLTVTVEHVLSAGRPPCARCLNGTHR